jgi:hypothetical protein
MFASCLPDLIGQAKKIVVECDGRLAPLFARSFPRAEVHGRQPDQDMSRLSCAPGIDWQIAMGSLPGLFRTTLASFPKHSGYLVPDAHAVQSWRQRLTSLGDGIKIGISWRGGSTDKTRRQRSTSLEQWLEILRMPGAHFINLQYGDSEQELRAIRATPGISIADWEDIDPLANLDDFAALIASLDLVISIDNATVHMAGALGTPTWVLQPYVPDWRWFIILENSPWYPSLRYFRQPAPGDWDAAFAGIVRQLRELTAR